MFSGVRRPVGRIAVFQFGLIWLLGISFGAAPALAANVYLHGKGFVQRPSVDVVLVFALCATFGMLLAGRSVVVWISSQRVSLGLLPGLFAGSFVREGIVALGIREVDECVFLRGCYQDGSESVELVVRMSGSKALGIARYLGVEPVFLSELRLHYRDLGPETMFNYHAQFHSPPSSIVECRYLDGTMDVPRTTLKRIIWSPGQQPSIAMQGVHSVRGFVCWELRTAGDDLDCTETVTPIPAAGARGSGV